MDRERLRCLRRFPRRAPFDVEEVPTNSMPSSESSDRSADSNLKKMRLQLIDIVGKACVTCAHSSISHRTALAVCHLGLFS